MRFWEDMQTKFGFNDGEAIPDGIDIYRSIYIRTVNRLAEKLNSQVRVAAYDRVGAHNFYLILLHPLSDLEGYRGELTEHTDISADIAEADDAMDEAIRQAHELELDSFVQVRVTLTDDFEEFVTHLRPKSDNDPLVVEVNGQEQHIYLKEQVRLVHEVTGFGSIQLAAGSDFMVQWIDHQSLLVGLATDSGNVVAAVHPEVLIVVEMPTEGE